MPPSIAIHSDGKIHTKTYNTRLKGVLDLATNLVRKNQEEKKPQVLIYIFRYMTHALGLLDKTAQVTFFCQFLS